jgi:hypothetical protein
MICCNVGTAIIRFHFHGDHGNLFFNVDLDLKELQNIFVQD